MQPVQSSHLSMCEIRVHKYDQSQWELNELGIGHRAVERVNSVDDFPLSSLADATAEVFDTFCKEHPNYNPAYPFGKFSFELKGGNALASAANYGNSKLVQHILNLRIVWIDQGNYYGSTPLYLAALCQNKIEGFLAAKILIEAGADVNLETFDESQYEVQGYDSAIGEYITSEQHRDYNEIKMFLYKEFYKPTFCNTPLWIAAEKSHNLSLVKLLLLNGGMIYRPLSKEGQAFVDKAVTQLFEQIKPLLCACADSSSSFSSVIDVIPQIVIIRTQILEYIH